MMGQAFPPAPAGTHPAVCVDVVDLGDKEFPKRDGTKYVSRAVALIWEIGAQRSDGRRYEISQRYAAYWGPSSWLQKALESWRGKAFTAAEINSFDLKQVIGKPCRLTLIHNISKSNGKTYANVREVLPPSEPRLTPSGRYERRKPAATAAAPQDVPPPEPENFF